MSAEHIVEGLVDFFLGMAIFAGIVIGDGWLAQATFSGPSTLEFPSLPKSESLGSIEDLGEGLECKICFCKEINVRFRECAHGACATCTLEIWKSRVVQHNLLPSWFPCHLCRAQVKHLGASIRVSGGEKGDAGGGGGGGASLDSRERVTMSDVASKVSEWQRIVEWVKGLSEDWGEYVSKACQNTGPPTITRDPMDITWDDEITM
ncbi:hypothetical protein L873DRAFT_1803630 [Choiromyces venosus 120613-1]|uniref:RING-type domain-containing protein n=1 Tax=Choiromyces venosus 120613-1 TaxID=1336337 RepID=A0A3N4JW45_9PEZI|nr:hypothetical protein L873DRAFT_1803630 [Choiromyces venosus 120613-1]